MAEWNFKRLPEWEHENAVRLTAELDERGLMDLHDQYNLSPNTYCCDGVAVIKWFKYGIENGQIGGRTPNEAGASDSAIARI